MNLFNKLYEYFSQDLAIDLGTANTLVYARGQGVILNEPSVVAVKKTVSGEDEVLAVGRQAKFMLGRTPGSIKAIRPIKDGVIANFEITQKMLKYFIICSSTPSRRLIRPRIVICVPFGITQVEKKAVKESAYSAGAREVYLIEEPMAAAIGAGLPITEAKGSMIVDIGGGTTGIAVISLNGIVHCESIKVAGDRFDEDIINFVRRKKKLLIGERTAENIKINIGTADSGSKEKTMEIKGRDMVVGAPRIIKINNIQINEALKDSLNKVVDAVKTALEKTPPELAADIVDNGVILTGGGALLNNLDVLLREKTGLPVSVAKNPLSCVVLGSGQVLDQLSLLKELTIT